MSWTDGMIVPGLELVTDVADSEIKDIRAALANGENPMTFKRRLAREIVAMLVSKKAADEAEAHFSQVHQKHETPEDIPVHKVESRKSKVADILFESGLVTSKTEARRQIEQGGVKIDGVVVKDPMTIVSSGSVIQKGKRYFVRLV